MFEPITLLSSVGLSAGAKFAYNLVLSELKKDETKEWVKDMLQDWLTDVAKDQLSEGSGALWEKAINKITRTLLEQTAETATAAFLVLLDNHLANDLKLPEDKRAKYQKPLNNFLKEKKVRQILGSPLSENCHEIDVSAFKETWDDLGLRDLPEDFDWNKLGNAYLSAVRKILNESDELKPLLNFQRAEKNSQNLEAIAPIAPGFDLAKYQETILERYGNLKLESIDSSGYTYDKELKIYQIFIPQNVRECQEYLPQVYELPKESQRKLIERGELDHEIDPDELERFRKAYTKQQTRSVLEVITDDKNQYLVILGDPGSGKSTLLQYLAVEWARLPTKELPSHPITILVELRAYIQDFVSNKCQNFLEFIHKGSNFVGHLNQHKLDKQLKQGKIRVLFDGLDEVFDPKKRDTVIKQIHSFTQKYDQVKIIVTSRIIGYKPQQLKDAEFMHFMLQDLEPEQIENFLVKWHNLTYREASELQRKQERQQRITKAVKESSAIQQLAGNPLLLTMMAILNRNQDLPRDRAKLYERSSELLLYQWDVEAKLLEDPELKAVYIDYSDKQAMLREVAHFMQASEKGLRGNLISKDDLRHVLVEYLKTIDVSPARKVARLIIEQLRTRNFILCDIGSNYYAFVHRTFLEYFCAWSYIWQFEKIKTLSIEQIKAEVYGKHWQDESWHEVLRLIAGMLEPKFVGEIIEYLINLDTKNEETLLLSADFLAELKTYRPIKDISNRLFNEIKDLIKYHVSEYVRASAVRELARKWSNEPSTFTILKNIIQQSTSSISNWDVINVAIEALASYFSDNPETFSILKNHVEDGNGFMTRLTALQKLSKKWSDHPETFQLLKELASFNQSNQVKELVLRELAQKWNSQDGVFEILENFVLNDPFVKKKSLVYNFVSNPREIALKALVENFPSHPRTIELLSYKAQSDPDNQVKEYAKQALAKFAKTN